MGDGASSFITKLIAAQSERRDNVVWLCGLRGEEPDNSFKGGLQSLNLRYNSFKDYVACEIAWVLTYDTYVKSIDLRNNLIKEKGVKELVNVIKAN